MEKVKIKTESESHPDQTKVFVKKKEQVKEIPAHLAAILALKPIETALEPIEQVIDAKSFFKQKDRLEADPDRSLIGLSWDSKDRLVLEFDDGEELISPPVPVGSITNTSVVVSGSGNSGGGGNPITGVAESFETVSKNLGSENATYTYSASGDLQTISYDSGITKTLNYTSGNLTSVVLSGNTPNGIELTKSFSYTSGNLTGVTYT